MNFLLNTLPVLMNDEYTMEFVIVAFHIHCFATTVYDADSVRSLNTCLFKLFVSTKIDAQLLMRL